MAADLSSSTPGLVGLLVPATWCHPDHVWSAQSSYTQAGPRPGVPEPQQASDLVLESSGTQAASTQLRVRVQKAGDPAPEDGAGIVWENEGDSLWRGWDPPRLITGWEALNYSDTAALHRYTHCVRLTDGTVVLAYQKTDGGVRKLYTRTKTETGSWSSEALAYAQSATANHGLHPCLIATPDGACLLLHWVEDSTSTEAQVRVHRSTDSGATFSVASQFALQTTVDIAGSPGPGASGYDLGRLRAAYAGGQYLLIAQMTSQDNTPPSNREIYKQFASPNGVRFELIETGGTGAANIFGYQEVIGLESGFAVLYCGDSAPTDIRLRLLESAYQDFSSVSSSGVETVFDHAAFDGTNKVWTDGDLAAWRDEDGILYVITRLFATGAADGNAVIARSVDNGTTWENMGDSSVDPSNSVGLWWNGDTACYPVEFSGCSQAGRAVVPHRWAANPGNEDQSLAVLYLGGWTTVCMPGQQTFEVDTKRVGWEFTWLPFELPDDLGWTATSSATYSATLETPGRLNLTTSGGTGTIYYSLNPNGTLAEGMILRAALAVNSGGSLAADQCAIRMRLADGVGDYDVSIRFTTTGFRCYDNNGAAAIGADVTVAVSSGVEILAALDDGNFRVWYRLRDQSPDKDWTAGPTSSSVTNDAGTPAANNLVRFGVITAADVTAYFYELHFVTDEYTGPSGLAAGQDNPADLFPRPLTAESVYVDGGVYVRGTAGPGRRGDEFDIDTRYDYALSRVFPTSEPSPRRGWRSIGVASDVEIALRLDTTLGDVDGNPGSDLIAFYLDGINWRTATLKGRTGGAWVTLASLDSASDHLTLGWAREGNTVIPNSGGSQAPYLHANEYAGGYFQLASGVIRRIARHTGGSWRTTGQQTPRLELEGITGAEASSGTTGAIWAPRLAVLHHCAGVAYAGFKLVIGAQTTVESDLRVGSLVCGPVYATTPPSADGIAWSTQSGQAITVARDGTGRARSERPTWRTLTMTWGDPVYEGALMGDEPTPDWIEAYTGSGGEGVATPGDPLRTLEGVLQVLDEARLRSAGRNPTPVVALPRIPVGSTQTVVLTRREDFLYGWFRGPVARRYTHEITGARRVLATGSALVFEEVR